VQQHFDIVIVGSGIVGAATALALAKETSLQIAVVEAHPLSTENAITNLRVSAISLASHAFFQSLGIWNHIPIVDRAPYTHMHVWEEEGKGHIYFDCQEIKQPALGYIVSDHALRTALINHYPSFSHLHFFCPQQFISLQQTGDGIFLTTTDQQLIKTRLLIGADGANSWVREKAHIQLSFHNYQHIAIIATVQTEKPHAATARQCFLAEGPLAFLPLADAHHCSIVWSTTPHHAKELLALTDQEFCQHLGTAFNFTLGKIFSTSARIHFPLYRRHAAHYILPHLALLGDAAHTVHPLAGQGVNLGLMDAESLVSTIKQAITQQKDFSHFANLRRYERARKAENLTMMTTIDILQNLFCQKSRLLKQVGHLGMALTNRSSFIKKFLVNYAVGKR